MPTTIAFVLLAGTLMIAAATDWRSGKVYNWLTYSAMLGGLLYWSAWGLAADGGHGALEQAMAAGFALAAGLIPFAVIFALGGLGGGDVKLMGAVGALSASSACVLTTACYAFVIAAGFAVIVMIRRRIVCRTLGRILLAAFAVASRTRPEPFDPGPRIPFAVAVAVGGILAGAEHLLGLTLPWSAWGP